jgi:predicted ester cyclase
MGIATQLIDEGSAFYNKADIAGFVSLYGDEVVLTTPDGRFEGLEATGAYFQAMLTAFPDSQVSVGRRCEGDDLYLGEFTVTGTNTGPLGMPDGSELPPTQNQVELRGMEIAEVKNGKIVRHDMVWDNMALLTQLGLAPAS